MKLGFTGTREGGTEDQKAAFVDFLDYWDRHGAITEFHDGDCEGSDYEAHHIMKAYANYIRHRRLVAKTVPPIRFVGHPPQNSTWRAFLNYHEKRSPLPYLRRNRAMVSEITTLVAWPNSKEERLRSGTWATVRYARKRGIRIIIIYPDGAIREEGPK